MFSDAQKLYSPFDPNVWTAFVFISPEMASQFNRPERQRLRSERTTSKYRDDMVSGDWRFTGDTIKFDVEGFLIDGQHRMAGIVDSGVGQWCQVVGGLSGDVILACDQNRSRSFADQLWVEYGVPNHYNVAAVTNRVWQWTNGNYGFPEIARIPSAPYLHARPSAAQLNRTFLTWRPEIESSVRNSLRVYSTLRKVSPSVLGFAWFLLGLADPDGHQSPNPDYREKFFSEICGAPSRLGTTYPPSVMYRVGTLGQRRLDENPDLRWYMLPYIFETWNRWLTWEKAESGQEGQTMSALSLRNPISYNTLPHPIGVPVYLPRDEMERKAWDASVNERLLKAEIEASEREGAV